MRTRVTAPADETFSSATWMPLEGPLVPATHEGALELGDLYLRDVGRLTASLVRPHARAGRVSLRLAGLVDLISFDSAVPHVRQDDVECRFGIAGGLLVARRGGWLAVVQRGAGRPELGLVVHDYAPRLAAGRFRIRRVLYESVQARLHLAISGRFLRRMRERSR